MGARPEYNRSPFDDLRNWPDEVRRRADGRRKFRITRDRRKPGQELGVVIGIKVPEFGLGRDRSLDMREMGMEKSSFVLLGGLVHVSVERWRLHEGKQQGTVHQ